MSFKTWKAEFYPLPAAKVTKSKALDHSIQKWKGLLPESLQKHNCVYSGGEVSGADAGLLAIDAESCALCKHYINVVCGGCPLFEARGQVRCDHPMFGEGTSPYHRSPEYMLEWLHRAKKWAKKGGAK